MSPLIVVLIIGVVGGGGFLLWRRRSRAKSAEAVPAHARGGDAAAAGGAAGATGAAAAVGQSDGAVPEGTVDPLLIDIMRRHYMRLIVDLDKVSPPGDVNPAHVPPKGMRYYRKRHGRRVVLVTSLVTILALALLVGAVMLMGSGGDDEEGAEAASADVGSSAEFGTGDASAVPGAGEAGAAGEAASGGAAGSTASGGAAAPGQGAAAGGQQATSPSGDAGQPTAGGGGTTLLKPKPGVYSFAASGVTSLKLLTFEERRPMPPTISAILTTTGDCWTIAFKFSTKQDETITYCATPDGGLTSNRSTATQSAFGSSVDVSVKCSQIQHWVTPGMTPGQTWPSACDTTSRGFFTDRMEVVGPITFVGVETVDVGGTPVQAYHMHKDDTITGAQDGSSSFDLWIAVEDGMIVRFLRDQSSTGIANYTEQVDLRLQSLTPRT